jgi:hypothetical protein
MYFLSEQCFLNVFRILMYKFLDHPFSRSGLTATVIEFSTVRTNTTGLVLPLLLNGVKNVHQKTNDLVTKSEEQK